MSWTGDSFSVLGVRRVALVCVELWLSRLDAAEPLPVLGPCPLWLLWPGIGVTTGMAAGHPDSCSCGEALLTCVLPLDWEKTHNLIYSEMIMLCFPSERFQLLDSQ